jgi:hypothetical protein
MSFIIYGGLKYLQVRHAIHCLKCKDTIESKFMHDFKMCSCNLVGLDGGIDKGNRIIGPLEHMEQRSMYCAYVNEKQIWLPSEVIDLAHLNMISNYK